MENTVRRAGPADVAAVTTQLVNALSQDPVAEWLVPGEQERPDVLHRLLAVEVDHAVETGYVDVLGDWSAVAVWKRHDLDSERWALGNFHLTTFAGRAAPRFGELNAAMRSYRSDAPHHWLSWLAVQPGYAWSVAGACFTSTIRWLTGLGIRCTRSLPPVPDERFCGRCGRRTADVSCRR